MSSDSLKHAQLPGGPLTAEWAALTLAEQVPRQHQQLRVVYEAATPAQRQTPEFKQLRAAVHRLFNQVASAFLAAHAGSLVSLDRLDFQVSK